MTPEEIEYAEGVAALFALPSPEFIAAIQQRIHDGFSYEQSVLDIAIYPHLMPGEWAREETRKIQDRLNRDAGRTPPRL